MLEISNVSIVAAFAAGIVSFLSPCCLPLVPGYLSAVSRPADGLGGQPRVAMHRMLLFLGGFMAIFVAVGLSASLAGRFLLANRPVVSLVAGSIVVAMGLLMLRPQGLAFTLLSPAAGRLSRRLSNTGPLLAGSAFAIGWTPCIGPILAAVLTVAAARTSTMDAGVLLATYAAGLAVPFIVTGLAYNRLFDRLRAAARLRRGVNAAGAVVLIVMGMLLAADKLVVVNIALQRAAAIAGLDLWRYL